MAQQTVVAFVGALSGPAASAGRDQRDGFLLGWKGPRILQLDDGGDPHRAAGIADRLLKQGIRVVTGLTTEDSALALQARLRAEPVLLVSSGAAPVALAGEKCSGNFFSVAPAADAVHENAGAIAHTRGYGTVYALTSSTADEAIAGAFRRKYSGRLLSSSAQAAVDARSAIREIRDHAPTAVYVALAPAAMMSFLRSYEADGLFHRIPVIAANVEPGLLEDLGRDFSGLIVSARWAAGMETARSAEFVATFRARHGRTPSTHALQGYEAAVLLNEAFATAGADPRAPAVAKALRQLSVEGVAGGLRVAANGFAITDWHAWEVFNESSGSPYLGPRERTLSGYAGPHMERCKLKSVR